MIDTQKFHNDERHLWNSIMTTSWFTKTCKTSFNWPWKLNNFHQIRNTHLSSEPGPVARCFSNQSKNWTATTTEMMASLNTATTRCAMPQHSQFPKMNILRAAGQRRYPCGLLINNDLFIFIIFLAWIDGGRPAVITNYTEARKKQGNLIKTFENTFAFIRPSIQLGIFLIRINAASSWI